MNTPVLSPVSPKCKDRNKKELKHLSFNGMALYNTCPELNITITDAKIKKAFYCIFEPLLFENVRFFAKMD